MCVKTAKNIAFYIPNDLLLRLDREADKQMTSRASVVRKALVEHLRFEREDEATA